MWVTHINSFPSTQILSLSLSLSLIILNSVSVSGAKRELPVLRYPRLMCTIHSAAHCVGEIDGRVEKECVVIATRFTADCRYIPTTVKDKNLSLLYNQTY